MFSNPIFTSQGEFSSLDNSAIACRRSSTSSAVKRPGPVSSRKVATIRFSPCTSYFWLIVAGPCCFRDDCGSDLGVKPAGRLMRYCT